MMIRRDDGVLQRVRRANPVDAAVVGDTSGTRAGEQLLADVLATPRARSGRVLPGQVVGWPRRGVAAIAAAAVVVAVLGGLVLVRGTGSSVAAAETPPPMVAAPPRGAAPAGPLLRTLALRAGRHAAAPGRGRFDYVHMQAWYLDSAITRKGTTSAVQPVLVQRWTAADGSGRRVESRGHATVRRVGSTDTYRAVIFGQDRRDVTVFGRDGNTKVPLVDMSSWSTDPHRLAAQLLVNAGNLSYHPDPQDSPVWFQRFHNIVALHEQQVVPPRLHAAMLRVLADTVPGLVTNGPVTDPVGRRGVAVSVNSSGYGRPARFILVFDPHTGALLDYEYILTTQRINPATGRDYLNVRIPAVVEYEAFLTSGHTGTATASR